jgi:hypothetical protein
MAIGHTSMLAFRPLHVRRRQADKSTLSKRPHDPRASKIAMPSSYQAWLISIDQDLRRLGLRLLLDRDFEHAVPIAGFDPIGTQVVGQLER